MYAWSWDDVPWPQGQKPPPRRAVRAAPSRHKWSFRSLAEGEARAAPAGATLRQAVVAARVAAHRYGMRFVIEETEAGLFVRRVPHGECGLGVEIVRAPVSAGGAA